MRMKKWLYSAMLAIVPAMAFTATSCNDDDDLPNVDITLNVEGGTIKDGVIYVVQGDTLNVAGVNVVNNDAGKPAAIAYAKYYWDYVPIGLSAVAPWGMDELTTEKTPTGNYLLELFGPVLAVDKELANFMIGYKVSVVESASDIPDSGSSSDTTTTRLTDKSK